MMSFSTPRPEPSGSWREDLRAIFAIGAMSVDRAVRAIGVTFRSIRLDAARIENCERLLMFLPSNCLQCMSYGTDALPHFSRAESIERRYQPAYCSLAHG